MAASNFDRALALVLRHEGGYVDHPRDPGGATNMGITHKVLAEWRGRAVSKADVKALTRAEAAAIYRRNYWDKVKADDLPAGVDYAVFDFAVNSGPHRAVTFLQDVAGVPKDGKIGAVTLGRLASLAPSLVVRELCGDRLSWLRELSTWTTFGKGWERRVNDVRDEALVMAASLPPDVPLPDAARVGPGRAPRSSPLGRAGLRALLSAALQFVASIFNRRK